MIVRVDAASPVPPYAQLREQIAGMVLSGILPAVRLAMDVVDVSPAEVSPAEVSPAEVAPAEVAPAAMAPAEVAPAAMAPDSTAER